MPPIINLQLIMSVLMGFWLLTKGKMYVSNLLIIRKWEWSSIEAREAEAWQNKTIFYNFVTVVDVPYSRKFLTV